MLWALTGTQVYATNAVTIMDTYAARLKAYNSTNAPLQSAWGAAKWTRAAELTSHTGAAWPAASAAAFARMLTTVTLPLIFAGSSSNGNWEATMIEAMMGIAVLTENATLLSHAAAYWSQRAPAYLYVESDGGAPVPAPRGSLVNGWYGQVVFNASTSGVCQEVRRFGGRFRERSRACCSSPAARDLRTRYAV